ncbi:MAG: glycosyltransferase family 2 protein [Deltaproteobacteria bacterium]|nr:glycosyltransferase family 2 protein [Deltaproteobacteria bacterium]
MNISVIITTYNSHRVLERVLAAYNAQSVTDFELFVADDGSGAETAQTIAAFQKSSRIPIHHIWQEDAGFRVAAIRNRALAATAADYVIFSDGDCIPSLSFVERHRQLAERGWFVAGSRVLLNEAFTKKLLEEKIPVHEWRSYQWLQAAITKKANRWSVVHYLPLPSFLRKLCARGWQGVMTCNLACWREDLLAINGFDEEYEGWGLEDSDLVIRLLNQKISRKSARFATVVFHLWHKKNSNSNLENNRQRLLELLRLENTKAKKGVEQYLVHSEE